MKLFLSGGGSAQDSRELDDLFANSLDKSKPLLYIPLAMDETKKSYDACFKFISEVFNPRGIRNIVMWVEKDLERKSIKLNKFGGIYIGGGNTFYLLKKIKETNFDNLLINAINKGIPYYGGSAGAIICGKTIKLSELSDINFVGLKDLNGLNLLGKYSIICHYENKNSKKMNQLQKSYGLSIIALPEGTGLVFEKGSLKVVGNSSAVIFEKNQTIRVSKNKSIF